MAAKNDPQTDSGWQDATPANESGWGQEVEAESKIELEAEGDGFIATMDEVDAPNANGITQVHLSKVFDLNETFLGDSMFINAGRDLERKLRKVPNGSQIRVQWVSSLPTGQKTPMRVFNVQWR
jgi:hypothetical protein